MPEITFAKWMVIGVPFSTTFLLVAWYYLTRIYADLPDVSVAPTQSVVRDKLEELGPLSRAEKRVSTVFVLTAAAWIFREPIRFGLFTVPGWASSLGISEFVHDSTVAVLASLLLFLIPGGGSRGEPLLDWDHAVEIPWGVLILFGGGLALADGFESTGLSQWAGNQLLILKALPLLLVILALCLMMTFLTEVTSNTATTTILLPILAGAATTLALDPRYLMIPAAMSASCAFMLPVATPPNAIIFGSDRLTIPDMGKAGLWLNLAGIVLVTFFSYTLVGVMFASLN
jgi:sodium-dependent dicarboxylate transporter 2/3/5